MKNIINLSDWISQKTTTPPPTDEEIKARVKECNSLEDMAKLVEKIWWIKWSSQFFSAKLFRQVIEWVKDWTYPVIQITRSYWLRDRAMMILLLEKNKNTVNSIISCDDCPELWED